MMFGLFKRSPKMAAPRRPVFLIDADALEPILSLVDGALDGMSARDIKALAVEAEREHRELLASIESGASGEGDYPFDVEDGVAHIPVIGAISHRPTCMMSLYGGTSSLAICAMLDACAADLNITGVFAEFDSPGGDVDGTAELAAAFARLREVKPVVAFVNTSCCSAAYWAASHCSSIILSSENARVGSIGIVAAIADKSAAVAESGVKFHKFVTGPQKGVGMFFSPITDEQLSRIDAEIQALGGQFVAVVNGQRKTKFVLGMGAADGASYSGSEAVKMRLADDILPPADALALLGVLNPGEVVAELMDCDEDDAAVDDEETDDPRDPLDPDDDDQRDPTLDAITPEIQTNDAPPAAADPTPPTPEENPMLKNEEKAGGLKGLLASMRAAAGIAEAPPVAPLLSDESARTMFASAGFALAPEAPVDEAAFAAFASHLTAQAALAADGVAARKASVARLCTEMNVVLGAGTVSEEEADKMASAYAAVKPLAEIEAELAKYAAVADKTLAVSPSNPEIVGQGTLDPALAEQAKVAMDEKQIAEFKARAEEGYNRAFRP